MKTSDLVILVADAISESGQLVCKKLAAAGHVVFGGYEAPAPECLKYAASITPLPLDVSCDNSVSDAITHIIKATQRIDIVINNLRAPMFGAIEAVHIGIAEQYINKMLIGTARLQNAVLPVMRAQGFGRIINFNSSEHNLDASFSGWQTAVVAALGKMNDSVNRELSGTGVAVTNKKIGLFNTQSTRPYISEIDHKLASVDMADVGAFNRKILAETVTAPTVDEEANMIVDAIKSDMTQVAERRSHDNCYRAKLPGCMLCVCVGRNGEC